MNKIKLVDAALYISLFGLCMAIILGRVHIDKSHEVEMPVVSYMQHKYFPVINGSELQLDFKMNKLVNPESTEMLAKIIQAESGAAWCSDKLQLYVGSVVLNRVESELFPDSIESVLNQKHQYGGESHWIDVMPCDRSYATANQLLSNGSVLPSNVLYQANFKQGSEIFEVVQDVYFCFH